MQKREFLRTLGSAAIAAPVAALTARAVEQKPANQNESVYARVIRTGTIRCGYYVAEPYVMKDPNTGELSGINVEIMNMLSVRLNLKLDWAEEITIANFIESVKNDRIDMMCASIWPNASRGREADFSRALAFDGVIGLVRADDYRFDHNIEAVNSPNITIATIDGDMAQLIAGTDFPKAKLFSMPDITDYSQMALAVSGRKADITFYNMGMAYNLMEKNPGILREVKMERPVRLFPQTLTVKKEQHSFLQMINIALDEMVYAGEIDKIYSKHMKPDRVYSVSAGIRQ